MSPSYFSETEEVFVSRLTHFYRITHFYRVLYCVKNRYQYQIVQELY